MIADYFVYRGRRLNLPAMYQENGEYRFTHGFSLVALIALVAGILPSLPGFFVEVKLLNGSSMAPFLVGLYKFAWFVGFTVAFAVYLIGRKFTVSVVQPLSLESTQPVLK